MTQSKIWKASAYMFIIGQFFSLFGSAIVTYGMIWYISLKTGSGFWLMLGMIAANLPLALFAPMAGTLVDKYNRKKLILISDGTIALITLFTAVLFHFGFENIILLLVISVLRSIGQSIQQSAGNALVQQIVPQEELTKINGAFQGSQALILILGPVLGGFVFGKFGLQATFYIDVFTALIEIGLLAFIVVPSIPKVKQTSNSFLRQFKDSVTYIKSSQLLKWMFVTSLVINALLTPVAYLAPLFIQRTFGQSVQLLSIGELAWGLGSLLGSILLVKLNNVNKKIRILVISMIAFGGLTALIGFTTNFTIYVLIIGLAGLFIPIMVTILTVILQENVSMEYMGRVFSVVIGISSVMSPLAMMVVGPLSDYMTIKWIYVGSSVLLITFAMFLKRSDRKKDLENNGMQLENANLKTANPVVKA
jgi:DHA3 family macrolide efflux protein-like MFS transporter